ncbi:unnamed protein product, partial [Ixodes hexagonus]
FLFKGGNQTESSIVTVNMDSAAVTLGAFKVNHSVPTSTSAPGSSVLPTGGRPPSSVISTDAGCRKRVVCETARTLTYVFPLTQYWESLVRDRPANRDDYFSAWSKGLLNQDCSETYPDCSDSPAGVVLPMVNEVVGPKGFVGSFLDRLARPSAPHVPRDKGFARPSVVMQRIRQSEFDFSRR